MIAAGPFAAEGTEARQAEFDRPAAALDTFAAAEADCSHTA